MGEKRRDEGRSVGAYIGSIVANAIILFVVNKVPAWNLRFITESFPAVLWALNLSIIVQMAGNALLIFFHPRFLHYLGQTVFGVFSLLAIIIIASVFPFDFSYLAGPLNWIVRIALIAGAFGTAVSVVVSIFRTIGSLFPRAD